MPRYAKVFLKLSIPVFFLALLWEYYLADRVDALRYARNHKVQISTSIDPIIDELLDEEFVEKLDLGIVLRGVLDGRKINFSFASVSVEDGESLRYYKIENYGSEPVCAESRIFLMLYGTPRLFLAGGEKRYAIVSKNERDSKVREKIRLSSTCDLFEEHMSGTADFFK